MRKLHSLTNCIWHYKLILRLKNTVFGTLLFNTFAHP